MNHTEDPGNWTLNGKSSDKNLQNVLSCLDSVNYTSLKEHH